MSYSIIDFEFGCLLVEMISLLGTSWEFPLGKVPMPFLSFPHKHTCSFIVMSCLLCDNNPYLKYFWLGIIFPYLPALRLISQNNEFCCWYNIPRGCDIPGSLQILSKYLSERMKEWVNTLGKQWILSSKDELHVIYYLFYLSLANTREEAMLLDCFAPFFLNQVLLRVQEWKAITIERLEK